MTEKPSYEELEHRLKDLETQLVAMEKSTSYSKTQKEKNKTKGDVFEEIVTNDKNIIGFFSF